MLLPITRGHAQLWTRRPDEGQGRPRRLLHHLAQRAGDLKLACPGHGRRFDEQDLSTGGRESQAGRHAGQGRPLLDLFRTEKAGAAEEFCDERRRHRAPAFLSLGNRRRQLATHPPDLTLQVAHAGFAGVIADDAR